jgi:hypothetical protein
VKISGTIRVACPACGRPADAAITQSINARDQPELKAQLLAGTLNVLDCEGCGQHSPLEATLAYHDPAGPYFAVVMPGERDHGEAALRTLGAVGTRRLLPSRNALVEKVKILDAGFDDRVIEVLKVLLLASRGHELDAVLLFDRVEGEVLHWLLVDRGEFPLASPAAGYRKLAATLKSGDGESLSIDRAWAVEAARSLVERGD